MNNVETIINALQLQLNLLFNKCMKT